MMENAGMTNICGSTSPPPCNGPDNPYMSGLANSYGIATRYVDLQGTSQPNYIGIMAATLNGCTSSCAPNSLSETNLVDRFEAAGLSWKAYMEDQTPVAGCDNSDHGFYEIAHNPFVAFSSIDSNASRCNKIVLANPANNSTCTGTDCALVKDLNSGSAPNFMWVTPNDCNNAHGPTSGSCSNGCVSSYTSPCEKAGDNYLSGLVPNILNSNTFKNTRAALFITFDEGSGFCPLNGSGEDCMYAVWAGPTAKTNSFSSSTLRNHYAFTKTIETNWNLATMTSNDAGATAMTEFFNAQSPDFTITASPSSLAFPFGSSANSTITLSSLGSFAGTVALTKSSTPTGLTLTLNPASVTLTTGGTGISTLTVSSSTMNNYTVTVTGTSGSLTHNAVLTVRVTPPPNFALLASPTSLTLTHAVSGVASPVTLNPTGDPTVFESSYLANSFYAKGLYWLFYEDSSNTCEHQAGCLTYTTSTNGSRWASPTKVPVHITDSDFSVTTNGTSIFYARYNESSYIQNCGRKLQLGIGNLSSSGTVAWQPEKTVTAGASNRVYVDDEIMLDSNGQIWIAYLMDNHSACGGNSNDFPLVIHSAGTNYNSWTGNFTFNSVLSGNWHIALVSLGGGQVYAAYWIAAHDVHGRLYNNGWQADEQISSTTTLSDVNGWLFNSGTSVYTIYFDDSTQSFNFAARSSTGTWTNNRIGIGESHTGTQAFPGYYSLPDAASYDLANNQFHLFYMNFTNQRIDEWSGSGSGWNKTTSVVATTAVPYPDSITSFIQSTPIEVGGIFYMSGSASAFNLNFAALTFASNSLTGSFTVTVTSQNGFAGTVTLSTLTTPSSGLTVNCTVTTITGGSGSSLCNLSSATPGSYNVNVTGVSGSVSHSAGVAVTVPAGADFTVTATAPSPTNVGQSQTSTVTIAAVNGFTGIISLSDTPPAGLTCGAITPNSITKSGTATISCNATVAGNYTLTLTGTSGSLSHLTTVLFQFRDFNTSASSPAPVNIGSSAISTITVASINHFNGVVTLTDVVLSGLSCGLISPSSLTGSGSATVSCSSSTAGNFTLSITGTSGSLVHNATVLFQFRDFTIAASSVTVNTGTSSTSTITIATVNRFGGIVTLSDSVPSGLVCGSISPGSITGSGTATVSCNATVAGNYTLTITGTSGSLVHSASPVFHIQDFGIAESWPAPVNAGSSATSTITINAINHFAGTVSVTDTVPAGLTCGTITPSSLTGSGSATVSCSATVAGNYTLTLTGANGSLVHTGTAVFQFQNFTITASSPSPVNAGSSSITTITVTSLNHFGGVVSLTDTLPSGMTCGGITPNSITGSGTATVSCSANIAGNYTLTLTGTSGSLVHSATALFQFRDFTVSATTPAPVDSTQSAASTITVAGLNHFSGTVNLSDSIPSGLICGALSPPSISGSGTATISCSANIAGNYTLAITAASGTLSRSASVVLRFQDFTITVTSPPGINVGQSPTSTITLASLNGFTGTVTFSVSTSSGLTCGSFSPTSLSGPGFATLSCAASVAGNYTATIIGTSTPLVHNATATFQFRDFTISILVPGPVNAGFSANSTITVSSLNHFAGLVSLTDTVPSGLSCGNITPGSVTGSGIALVSCNSNIAGNYTLTVTGTNSALSHSASVIISIQDYSITSNPAVTKIDARTSGSSTITITSFNHFSGTVSLSVSATAGLTRAINPASITGGSGTATLTFSSMMAGNYTLAITGSSGTITHTTTINLQISDFSANGSPLTITILAGSTGNSTLTIAPINGFSGTVNLILNPPMGLGAMLVPSSIAISGSSALTVTSSLSGDYTFMVQATTGTLSHTITIVVHVMDYSLAGSPTAVTAPVRSSSSSTLTLQSLNRYNGNINLTYIVQPDPSTASASAGGGGHHGVIFAPPTILPIVSISPQSFLLASGGTQQSAISITLPSNLPAGNYALTVMASDGILTHQIFMTIVATDFNVTATPNTTTLRPGSNATIVLNFQSLNFFQGNVTLIVTSQAGGPTGNLSTSIVQLTFYSSLNLNLTIRAPANTAFGNYTITVQATSGSLTRTLNIPVRVTATGLVLILGDIFSPHNALPMAALAIFAVISAFAVVKTRTYRKNELSLRGARMINHRNSRRSSTARLLPHSSGLPLLWLFHRGPLPTSPGKNSKLDRLS